jgi:hypothetical protein
MWPFVVLAGVVLWGIRRFGLQRAPLCRAALVRIGVLPIRRHYYEPYVCRADLQHDLAAERALPGIDWNIPQQLQFLSRLTYAGELPDLLAPRTSKLEFRLGNGSFDSGDAEYLYQFVRACKPARIFEVGSGQSTLIARRAILKNQQELPGYTCRHLCIEPFEAPWLESAGVTTVREKVEDLDRKLFQELQSGDLLFIDSSHIIRPQGDVLAEYLEILPTLKAGVTVHIHDVFSPRDYPEEWVFDKMLLWNEQYLLEAFLSSNESWQVIGAVNLLARRHFDQLRTVCPYLTPDRQPGSFYIRKTR